MTSNRRRSRFSETDSAAPPARHLRLQSTLFEELCLLFRGELADPLLEGLHLTSLELSPDGRNARIGFTLPHDMPPADTPRVEEALGRAQGYLRAQLAQGLDLKRVPHLRFVCVGVAPRELPPPMPAMPDDDVFGEGGEP